MNKKIYYFAMSALMLGMGIIASACGDDNDDPAMPDETGNVSYISANNTFPGKKVSKVVKDDKSGYNTTTYELTYNERGQVTRFLVTERNGNSQNSVVQYPTANRMKFNFGENVVEVTCGENMFARSVTMRDDSGSETFNCQYDSKGHVVRAFGDWVITWDADGNIVKVEDGDDMTITYTYDYSLESHGLFIPDFMFRIDYDDADDLCFFGVLGKATKNLPVKIEEKFASYPSYNSTWTLNWQIGTDGYPVSVTRLGEYGDPSYKFTWK